MLADALSRSSFDKMAADLAKSECERKGLIEIKVTFQMDMLDDDLL